MFLPFVRILCLVCLFLTSLVAPAGADVLVLGDDGRTARRHDPGVAARGERVPDASRQRRTAANRRARGSGARAAAARRRGGKPSVVGELRRIHDAEGIDVHEYRRYRDAYREAKRFRKRLDPGRRRIEMSGAIRMLKAAARGRWLDVSRLEPLWLTLERNREWWSEGPLLSSGQRVGFEGTELVWQYVPGQGLQIHPLANFGKLNALWRAKRKRRRLRVLLEELLTLPAERAGGLAWEYYFDYGGGRAPWVSALAQGTGLQSLARAANKLERSADVLPIAARGLNVFETAPPEGVRVPAGGGAHYLIYSFDPRLRVLNGFIQSLVGLHDFAVLANDARARALFEAGERRARVEVPRYDTGAWSMYSQARESDLGYHELLMGFLASLCERTQEPVYCTARERFARYLTEPPALSMVTRRLRGGKRGLLRFDLSKISTVTVRVSRRGRLKHSVTMRTGHGRRSVAWSVPRRRGRYDVELSATDLAGNAARAEATVRVLKPRKPKRRRRGD